VSPDALADLLRHLIAEWEGECVEFKEANDSYPTSDIGKYFSALSNEANLRGLSAAWLVFGVRDRDHALVGTSYRQDRERLNSLKQQIAQRTSPSLTLREIHELQIPAGRILLLEIPAAPRGIPIAWNDHYYARNGESLAALALDKLDEIRRQGSYEDWSAVVLADARIGDLDPAALKRAREIFIAKHRERIREATMHAWSDADFLDHAKLTIRGGITRAAIMLLGRPQSTHLLSPHVAELTWKLEGPEQDYEHFHPPFLLETSRLYQRIRNVRLRLERPGELIPVEFPKYDQRIVLEALHNCIAHQDYTRCERVLVIERPGELVFQNAGGFFDGRPEDYILGNRTPTRYRNRFLAEAMVNLRMIDTMGFGIREIMFRGQMQRYLPLPDFELADPVHVVLRLSGRFIDENYSHSLLTHGDMTLAEALALDRVQKGELPDDAMLRHLRERGLVEGRKPAIHISASVAARSSGDRARYIRNRRLDDAYYRDRVIDYLREFGEARREDIDGFLLDKLPDLLSPEQKANKIHNLLSAMKRAGLIEREGPRTKARWRLIDATTGRGANKRN
jgi:ATP-dependent DNA helicase RecG